MALRWNRLLIGGVLLVIGLSIAPLSQAQRRPAEAAVYVHDSGVANEKLALAEKLERLKEWDRSADVYLEVTRDFSDRVAAVDGDERRFINIVQIVQSRLAKWPAEGLAAFRGRFETSAATSLAAAGHDASALTQLANQYFLTDAAKNALMTLADDQLEGGEFVRARDTAQRVLDQHPVLTSTDRGRLGLLIAAANKLLGDDAAAAAAMNQIDAHFADEALRVKGHDQSAKDAAADLLRTATTQPNYPADRWLTPGGNAARDRSVERLQFGGTRMGFRDVDMAAPRGVRKNELQSFEQQQEALRPYGYTSGVFPLMDRGQLFFQDNAHLYAIDTDNGEPLAGWAETYPQGGVFSLPEAWPLPQGLPCLLTLTDDSVFATMGLRDFNAAQFASIGGVHSSRLVSVDRATGRPRWSMLNQQLPDNLATLDFAGCPYVDATTVYVQAHGAHGTFDDAYVLAFDRTDGAFRWSCYLCSANLGSTDFDPSVNPYPVATNLTADNGRLFVQTNNGAAACVNPISGAALWVSQYSRDALVLDRNDPALLSIRRSPTLMSRRPWEHNWPIASGENVYVMPDDSTSLLVYRQRDGVLQRRLALSDYDNARVLIGVVGNQAIFCSGKRLFCVDWTNYPADVAAETSGNDDAPPPRARDAIVWMTNDLKRAQMPDDPIRGRGLIAADSVIVPTSWQLLRFSRSGGLLKQAFPMLPDTQWSEGEGPGNLLAVGDALVVAGMTRGGTQRVSWYSDFNAARHRLEAAENAAPRRVEPLLRTAKAFFTAGQAAAAEQRLDQAMALAPAERSDPRTKSIIYTAAIDLARRSAAEQHGDQAVTARFFDRAALYLASPQQQVDYRLIRADFEKQRANSTGMITLYQQILSEPQWRNLDLLQGDRSTTAGNVAEETINSIRESLSGSYDEVEQAAEAAFANAQAAQTVDQLAEVAAAFPNSSVAGKAWSAAGAQAQFSGDHRRAVQLFRSALAATSETDERLQLLQQMAQSYIQLPDGLATAAGRLRQAARLAPNAKLSVALTLPDGRSLSDLSYVEAARQIEADAGAALSTPPDCAIPPNVRSPGGSKKRPVPFIAAPATELGNEIVSILDDTESPRNDRLVGKTTDGVIVVRAGELKAMYRIAGVPAVLQSTWAGTNLALLEPAILSVADGGTGHIRWHQSLSDSPTPPRLVVAAGESNNVMVDERDFNPGLQAGFNNFRGFRRARRMGPIADDLTVETSELFTTQACVRDRILCGTNRGRVLAYSLTDGALLWQRQVNDRPIVRLLASDDFVVVQTRDLLASPFVIDTLDGRLLHGAETAPQGGESRVLGFCLSPDGMLVIAWQSRLIIKDLFEPGTLSQPTFVFPQNELAVTFFNANDPQNLQIDGHRVYALSDGGIKLRVVNLEDGKAVMFNQSQSIDTGAKAGTPLQMLVDRQRCYVASENWVHGYDLARGSSWGDINTPQIHDIAVSQSHVIAWAVRPLPEADTQSGLPNELQLFSRTSDSRGAESGWLEYRYALPKGFAVSDWRVVDGGIYLLNSDHQLLWLGGAAAH